MNIDYPYWPTDTGSAATLAWIAHTVPTIITKPDAETQAQLDRIEAKLDKLLPQCEGCSALCYSCPTPEIWVNPNV